MSYSYAQLISTKPAACGSSDTANYPFCFFGTYAELATVANGGVIENLVTVNGKSVPADCIFSSDAAGSSLYPYEFANYDPVSGFVEVYIRITLSHTVANNIYLNAGNAAVSTYQGGSVGAAWDSGFSAVLHYAGQLFNLGADYPVSLQDSTANGNNGIIIDYNDPQSNGVIGGAAFSYATDGNGGYVNLGASSTLNCTSGVTVEAVLYAFGYGHGLPLSWKLNTANTAGDYCFTVDVGGNDLVVLMGGSSVTVSLSSTVPLNQPCHVAVTADGTDIKVYLNGALVGTQASALLPLGDATDVYLGLSYNGFYFIPSGSWTDETRISSVVRSAAYMLQVVNNIFTPSAFFSVGDLPASSGGLLLTSGF